MYVFICEDSLEGIFTGVYDACASRLGHRNIRLATGEPENYELFSEYIHVTPSADKTGKVIRTITSRFGMQFYESIYQAAMSGEPSSGRKDGTRQTPSMRPSSRTRKRRRSESASFLRRTVCLPDF